MDQVKKLLSKTSDLDVRRMITAYLCTGRRRAELVRLEWSEVDIKNRRYFVRQYKTHLSGWFPVNDDFMAVLESFPENEREGRVFKRWRNPDSLTHLIKGALRKAGLGQYSLHKLRHSFATLFISAGGTLRTLQELLGHTQYKTTEIYAHVTQDHLQDAANLVKMPPILKIAK